MTQDSKREAHLAGAGEQESGVSSLGKPQHVHGADEAGLDCLDGVVPASDASHWSPWLPGCADEQNLRHMNLWSSIRKASVRLLCAAS